jgi:hypothetical protein
MVSVYHVHRSTKSLFTMVKKWEHFKYPAMSEWINKIWYYKWKII